MYNRNINDNDDNTNSDTYGDYSSEFIKIIEILL